jgi:gamma-glutamyl hercynylcysteine S-oxide synthase
MNAEFFDRLAGRGEAARSVADPRISGKFGPAGHASGASLDANIDPNRDPKLEAGRRASLVQAINQARKQSDRIFRLVRKEWLDFPAIPLRHPVIFYWGHLEAFDLNLLERALQQTPSRDTSWDRLFAFGVDPASAAGLQAREWPAVPAVWKYAQSRRMLVDRLLPHCELRVLSMCLEHRLMHIETLIYLLHQLPYRARHAVIGLKRPRSADSAPVEMLAIPEGEAALGPSGADDFVWDNEMGNRASWEAPFHVSRTKITNGQYLDFVREGGPMPPFWRSRAGRFTLQGFHFEMPLPMDWPVYVSQEDAAAFARWRGASLPSEAQFHRYSQGRQSPIPNSQARTSHGRSGQRANVQRLQTQHSQPPRVHSVSPTRAVTLFDCDPCSVSASAGQSVHGVQQCFANGWEWTRDPFEPLGDFQPDPLYPGYSEPFFGAEHSVLKGASPATPPRLGRASFRNWFRNDYRYAYTGFRLVSTD